MRGLMMKLSMLHREFLVMLIFSQNFFQVITNQCAHVEAGSQQSAFEVLEVPLEILSVTLYYTPLWLFGSFQEVSWSYSRSELPSSVSAHSAVHQPHRFKPAFILNLQGWISILPALWENYGWVGQTLSAHLSQICSWVASAQVSAVSQCRFTPILAK